MPIDHGSQIEKAVSHRNVSNIGAPDLIGSNDGYVAEKVWIDFVAWIGLRETRFGIEGFHSQNATQALNAFAVDFLAHHGRKHDSLFAGAQFRMMEIELIQQQEQLQVLFRFRHSRVVIGRARKR